MQHIENELQELSTNLNRRLARARKYSVVFSIIIVLIGLGWLTYSILKVKDLERKSARLNEKINYEKAMVEDLKSQKIALADSITELSLTISEINPERTKENKLNNLLTLAENAKYSIGLYSYKSNYKHNKIKNYLLNQNYTIIADQILDSKPTWLATESTVFYYHNSSEQKAQSIANELEILTGVNFKIGIGKGLGVGNGHEEITFYMYFLPDWFTVVASYANTNLSDAKKFAIELALKIQALERRDKVEIYQTRDTEVYAITIGGKQTMNDAMRLVSIAQKNKWASDAYAQIDNDWIHVESIK